MSSQPKKEDPANQSVLSASERLNKLKQLKALKNKTKAENRKDLYKEYEKKKTDQKMLEKLNERQDRAQEEMDQLELEARGVNYERLKNLNYTVEDDETWNEKLKSKSNTGEQRGFQNYSHLAEQTYLKRLKKMEKLSDEDYNKQKQAYEYLKSNGNLTEAEIISKLTDKKMLEKLVVELKEQDQKSYKKRKIRDDDDDDINIGFINDKNKQFNDKLNRHFDKYLTDLHDNIRRGGST